MIVLINLGSPNKLTRWQVAKYLFHFLMDKNVITAPFFIRLFIVGILIAPFRSKNTLKIYSKIWFKDKKYGSPLLYYTDELAKKLQKRFPEKVLWAMRYRHPSLAKLIQKKIKNFSKNDKEKIIFVPLYPHYTLSTFTTVEQKITSVMKKYAPQQNYKITKPFWNREDYLDLLVHKIKHSTFFQENYDFLLFSYHGIPEVHLKMVDDKNHCLAKNCCDFAINEDRCYHYQTMQMSHRIAEKLHLTKKQYGFSYQSRLGPQKWLSPNTEETIKELPKKKINKLAVISPAFVSDNLETLYEINIELKEIYEKEGGEKFLYISCPNDDEKFTTVLEKIISEVK